MPLATTLDASDVAFIATGVGVAIAAAVKLITWTVAVSRELDAKADRVEMTSMDARCNECRSSMRDELHKRAKVTDAVAQEAKLIEARADIIRLEGRLDAIEQSLLRVEHLLQRMAEGA